MNPEQIIPKSSAPALPPELEQHIFSICALSRPTCIPSLMLVASRVKDWIELLLYRTIILTEETLPVVDGYPNLTLGHLLVLMRSKPAPFFRASVRHLFSAVGLEGTLIAVLTICTGVENLHLGAIPPGSSGLPLIAPSPLRHLYACLDSFFRAFPPPHRRFSDITHLQLMDEWTDATGVPLDAMVSRIREGLSTLPRLTHLSFTGEDFLPGVLWKDPEQLRPHLKVLSKDFRFVTMRLVDYLNDWKLGVHTGNDYWNRVEIFISKRRAGQINALQYCVPDNPLDVSGQVLMT
ncbi:hypothetical protein DFH07DRAFT_460978 [Mycena maculata]|uniref:Uncharacterized protein n=1 Tax=Mycena maculata TaxID=230809 RepID=A0AAD7NEG9_9AGAR|nr:hypothetical protein DFH07DRAFT_460978 [Mycena maculata]